MFKRPESWVWLGVWVVHLLAGWLLTRADARYVPIGFNPMLFSFFLIYAIQNYRFQDVLEDKYMEYDDFSDSVVERLYSNIIVASLIFLMISGVFLPWFNLAGTIFLAVALLLGKLLFFRQKPSTFNWSWLIFFAMALSLTGLEYTWPLGSDTPALMYWLKLIFPTVFGLTWTIEAERLLHSLDNPAVREKFVPPQQ